MQQQRDFLAGVLIGLSAMLKVYPAVLGVYFLLTRRWNALAGMLTAAICVSMFTLITLGAGEHFRFFVDILPVLLREYPSNSLENISIGNYVIFFGAPHTYAKLACTIALWFSLLLSVLLLFRAPKPISADEKREALALEFSAFLLVTLIGTANSWWNYQLLVLIPVYTIVAVLARSMRNNLITVLVFAVACAMMWLTSHIQWREALLAQMPVFWREVFFRGIASWLIFFTVINLRFNLQPSVTHPPG